LFLTSSTVEMKPKVACVGAGQWGRNLVRNFAKLDALAWVCDSDPVIRAKVQADFPSVQVTATLDRVLEDPDVSGIVVATPAETHAAVARQALLAGRDVLVEKPLALSVYEGTDLAELAARTDRILMVGHLLRYHPAVVKLKSMIDDGELGRIHYIYSNRLNLGKIRREENILWSFAPHDISVILGLVDETPTTVEAFGGNYLREQITDVTVSVLSFASGVKAHVFVSWLHPFKEQKLVVVGDRKMAVFDDLEPEHKLVVYPHAINWDKHLPVPEKGAAEHVPIGRTEPLANECEHFLECLRTRQAPLTDGLEAVRVLGVLEQCQRSLDRHSGGARAVKAPEPPRYSVHPSAFIDADVEIGDGTTIWHVSHVMSGSRIGRDCRIGQNVVIGPAARIGDGVKVQNNVSVYQGVTLEDHVFCGPSVVFTNVMNPRSEIPRMTELRSTLVKRGATLGANCTVVCGVTIGAYAFVGAGSVVLRDVPDFALVVGNPARLAGWRCVCGNPLGLDERGASATCGDCGRTFSKTGTSLALESSPVGAGSSQ
jgi:UDP-2-acetamido-3-amino-2,3-dideoxy-glucuronate N-acetyltransferase